jgi:hypothetical protein
MHKFLKHIGTEANLFMHNKVTTNRKQLAPCKRMVTKDTCKPPQPLCYLINRKQRKSQRVLTIMWTHVESQNYWDDSLHKKTNATSPQVKIKFSERNII